jgi:hypothetical protein
MHIIKKNSAILLMVICFALLSGQAVAEKPLILKPNRIKISYTKPQNPAHQSIYEPFTRTMRICVQFLWIFGTVRETA